MLQLQRDQTSSKKSIYFSCVNEQAHVRLATTTNLERHHPLCSSPTVKLLISNHINHSFLNLSEQHRKKKVQIQ